MDWEQVQADYAYCETIIKNHSNSFYYAFSKLPPDKANAVYAVYAFCRTADDCADSDLPRSDRLESLQRLKQELDLFKDRAEPDQPLWRALRRVFTDFEMDIQPFYDQLTGQSMDLDFSVPNTMEELENYGSYVAGSVGVMLLPILASNAASDLRRSAIDLGVAMQITNILRDVGEDYFVKQRIYLPAEELKRFGYSLTDLSQGLINDRFVKLWESLAARAESLYDRFYKHIELFDADSRFPLSLSVEVYIGILDAVRDSDYDCFSKRSYVSKDLMSKINAALGNCS